MRGWKPNRAISRPLEVGRPRSSSAPSSNSSAVACSTASGGGGSNHESSAGSPAPQVVVASSSELSSAPAISGGSWERMSSSSRLDQRRKQSPAAVRPARPRRWSAVASDTAEVRSEGRPDPAWNAWYLRSPESTTTDTRGTVIDVSAIAVASTTRLGVPGPGERTASCWRGGVEPWSSSSSTDFPSRGASSRTVAAISPRPGRKASTSPSQEPSASTTTSDTRLAMGAWTLPGRQWVSTGCSGDSTSMTGAALPAPAASPSSAETGPTSSVADITSNSRSSRNADRESNNNASSRSWSTERSWNSSSTTVATPSRPGSAWRRRNSRPGVTNSTSVSGPVLESSRTV